MSSYADWDVMARLPHGIEAIKHHLKHVDNVPLLVSLFTDSTPDTVKAMVGILRENGEVVMSIGSTYRYLLNARYAFYWNLMNWVGVIIKPYTVPLILE